MKHTLIIIFLAITGTLKGQDIVDWDPGYQLQLSDFRSPATQVGTGNTYTLSAAINMDFSFHMSNAAFMITRNFNAEVNCYLNRNAATLSAPDSAVAKSLLLFARYQFDLSELYARKFRKRLYEEKKTFSEARFFKPVFDEIQEALIVRYTEAGKLTDLGRNEDKLKELHDDVLEEIKDLADFCKSCKPVRKKKEK